MKLFKFMLILLTVFLTVALSSAQAGNGINGTVSGKVMDKKTGEELIGVSVMIEGTGIGTVTDFEGKFNLTIPPGQYNLILSYVSYTKKVIKGVEVKPKETITLNPVMEEVTKDLNEVVITAEVKKETASGLLVQQKNAASVSDGISAEAIKRTPDKSTGDVLKRISGASIQDNRFAIIRGLNERYTTAYINGAPLPSSESDRKAFSFDIFPSNLLDNLLITKTASPDLPGEFGGGVIEINTKGIPDNNYQSISLSTGFNTITTFKDKTSYQGGSADWLGMDDGTRKLPSGIPSDKDYPTTLVKQAEMAKLMPNNWALQNSTFSPNFGLQYSLGKTYSIGKSRLGTVMALTYSKSSTFSERERNSYDSNINPEIPVLLTSTYKDRIYSDQTLTGLLGNITYKINPNHQLSWKNMFSINSDNRVTIRNGTPAPLDENPVLIYSSERFFSSNRIFSTQLAGSDYLSTSKVKLNWNLGLSDVNREIPDVRRNSYSRYSKVLDPSNPVASDTIFKANIAQSNVGPDYAGNIFYSTTHEKIYSAKADAARSFDARSLNLKNQFKTGFLFQQRDRDFSARQLGYIKYAPPGSGLMFPDSILYNTDGNLFDPKYAGASGSGYGGYALRNNYKPTDTYHASATLTAAYLMADMKFKELIRIIYGVRVENYTQTLTTTLDNKEPYNHTTTKLDILPSANLIYTLTANQNIRLAYSQTVNRPEFRELAPFAFYDYQTRFVVSGEKNLQRALIHNYDLRYEWYPGKGQLFSVSGFYKSFDNPIEQVMRVDVSEEITYRNLKSAKVYGAEFEFRILLGSIFKKDPEHLLNRITVFSNLALIGSKVDLTRGNASDSSLLIKDRPLQGQSPYIINSGIQYIDNNSGWTASISYNKTGNRIFIVGSANEPDIWEKARDMVDMQIGKSFMKKKLEVKFNVQNLLAQNLIFFQDHNRNKSYDKGTDQAIWNSTFGTVYSVNIAYQIK